MCDARFGAQDWSREQMRTRVRCDLSSSSPLFQSRFRVRGRRAGRRPMGLLFGLIADQQQLPSTPEDAAAVVRPERAVEGLKAKKKKLRCLDEDYYLRSTKEP